VVTGGEALLSGTAQFNQEELSEKNDVETVPLILAQDNAHAGGPVREPGGPRRGFVPQAQDGPRHRCEDQLSTVQIKPL
jgi:hypothetical protein